ncbi:hypothetical protein GCM10027290_37080 [Micromonospora sonneratiae]|uniref:Uncharacterized protein n=1 Tax=Micromonospora sonneratiae TaxID=1184706 RepID=A0ABW3YPH9_9ACTN
MAQSCPVCGQANDSESAYCLNPVCGSLLPGPAVPADPGSGSAPVGTGGSAAGGDRQPRTATARTPPRGLLAAAAIGLVLILAVTGIWLGKTPRAEKHSADPGVGLDLDVPGPTAPVDVATPTVLPTVVATTPRPPRPSATTTPARTPKPGRTTPAPARTPSGPYVTTTGSTVCYADGWEVQATARLHNVPAGSRQYGEVWRPNEDGGSVGSVMVGNSTEFSGSTAGLLPRSLPSTSWWVTVELSDGREIDSAKKTARNPCGS